jgi:hypothetical protein
MSTENEIKQQTANDPAVGSRDSLEPNSTKDAARWLNGEISLGRFIHNSSLESCYAQVSDFAGGIANTYNERILDVHRTLEAHRLRAKAEYKAEEAAGDTINATASASAMRAYTEAQSVLRMALHFAL